MEYFQLTLQEVELATTTTPMPITPAQANYSDTAQWKQLLKNSMDDLRCASPAFLTKDMDPTTQTVTVQIAIKEQTKTNKGPSWVALDPVILVPVVQPRGGGFCVTLPLKSGDEGLLVFCDTCFDLWWTRGGLQNKLGPHRHEHWDCGFIPGMNSQPNLIENYSTTSMQLRADDGSSIVDISTGAVKVLAHGGTAKALVNDTFFQWYTTNVQPFLASLGYSGPPIPVGSETTILKGQ